MSFEGACASKRQYATREDAMVAQRSLQRQVKPREARLIRAYECEYSKRWPSTSRHWHVGHVSRAQKRKEQQCKA